MREGTEVPESTPSGAEQMEAGAPGVEQKKDKDIWDKLSSLSSLISGVVIAGLGLWLNHSLTAGQQRMELIQHQTEERQRALELSIEGAHNNALELQAQHAMDLQDKQFNQSQKLDQLRLQIEQAKQEQERLHDEAADKLQHAQLAKDLMPQLQSSGQARSSALALIESVDSVLAIKLSLNYSETSSSPELRNAATATLKKFEGSADPDTQKLAKDALVQSQTSRRIQAIVNVFETGTTKRDYNSVISIGSDLFYAGFGLRSGTLKQLVQKYINAPDAKQAGALTPYVADLSSNDASLATNESFKNTLRNASEDPVMQRVQDELFQAKFWQPAQTRAADLGLKLPLSLAVIYDSSLQGGLARIVTATNNQTGGTPLTGVDEKVWIRAYLEQRRSWFASSPLLSQSVNRVDTFRTLVAKDNWLLSPPIVVQGVAID
ncbi:chitosanase [Terriglobus sp. TAA 43]|uniref:chitosanase n=1 Tax=Terriglobus sp. TAA 43 TaxID=278961 RepID=UPI00068C7A15|nr:chitosanase [Terriglobus sp. TAA 43]